MASTLSQPAAKLSSPALRGFELNPFRVLRLPVNATTSEASFQAERILTLTRAGLPPEEPDALPWLPPAGVYEIQQAAQTVEEPLMRLTEQLLWFDLVRDADGAKVQSMIRDLSLDVLWEHLKAETILPEGGELGETDEGAAVALVAQAVNQANLRLLVAAALVNGVVAAEKAVAAEPREIARRDWKKMHGLPVLHEAHKVISDGTAGSDSSLNAQFYMQGALTRWIKVLGHPWFRLYLGKCIDDLGDDFVTADDAETIEESIRTRLADLASKETRFLLLEGRYSLASGMVLAVSKSGFEARVVGPALRPISHLFQSEISELQSLLEESAQEEGLKHMGAYLKRLEVIKQRWLTIDKAGLIGLSSMLDEAIEQAYLRLRNISQPSAELDALLTKSAAMAAARSLKERVNFYRKELEEASKRVCHFCKTGKPDYDKSVVLEGRKATRTEQRGNTITTYYAIRYGIVLRCERCARFHDFLGRLALLVFLALAPGILIIFYPIIAGAAIFLGVIAIYGGFALIPFLGRGFRSLFRYVVAVELTPSGHGRYGKHKNTDTYYSLKSEGYSVRAHWKSDAVRSLENKR
jgi:hypothetical protein